MRRHASPPAGNLDALVNKYRAAFRNADQPLAQAQAPIQIYRERYPELAVSLPEGTPDYCVPPGSQQRASLNMPSTYAAAVEKCRFAWR
jgi:hypothetical protein